MSTASGDESSSSLSSNENVFQNKNSNKKTPSIPEKVETDDGEGSSSDRRSSGKRVVRRQGSKLSRLLRGKRPPSDTTNSNDDRNGGDDNIEDAGAERIRPSKRPRKSQKPIRFRESDNEKSDDDEVVSAIKEEPEEDNKVNGDGTAHSNNNEKDDNGVGVGGKRKSRKPKRESPRDENKTTFDCPHCGKVFKTPNGLEHHIDNKVCCEEHGSPRKPVVREPKKRKAKSLKFRGTEEDRTCPHCNRLFTSALGAKYHIEQKVCRKAHVAANGTGKVRPFPTLNPGQQFSTPFGVAEVVRDDRAIPTAVFPKDVQRQHRKYKKSEDQKKTKDTGSYVRRSSKLRVRRNAINAIYQKGNCNRRSIFEAYFDGDPEHMKSVISANKALANGGTATISSSATADGNGAPAAATSRDPKQPKDSFPDRIVECISIRDERSHVLGLGRDSVKRDTQQQTPKTLWLQRRLLTEPYDKGDRVYYCPDCGRKFTSAYSRKMHCGQKKCSQEARTKKEKREAIESRIEREVCDIIRFPERRKFIKKRKVDTMSDRIGNKRKWKKKHKRELSVYPEILIGMGFKLVAKRKISVPQINPELHKPPVASLLRGGDHDMDHLLKNLKGAFKLQKRKADDQKYGSMYAEVYKGLGFKHPRKNKGTNVGNNISKKKRRKRAVKLKPPPPIKPMPPTIDVGALVDEIKSGRYPSIKVFEGKHEGLCLLCNKEGSLFCCKFCDKVLHLKCIRTKFTIKEPELDESFMCHRCIGVILSRRARAEKRRLLKQGNNEKLKKEEEQKAKAVKSPTEGREYPYMATQGQEVNELVELLKDSQIRLRRSIETTKMNNIRRQVISGVYPDGYSPPYWN